MPRRKASVTGLFTATRYSFSSLFSARRIALTMSPLLVSRIRPSESLSRRPIGKMRCSWPTQSTMLPFTPDSVVLVTPTGLLSAMYTWRRLPGAAWRADSGRPSTRTSPPSGSSAPTRARAPSTVTRPSAIRRSASRREQCPLSLMNLLRRMRLGDDDVRLLGVAFHPGRGVFAGRVDPIAVGARPVEHRGDQPAGDPAATERLRDFGMADGHHAVREVVIEQRTLPLQVDGPAFGRGVVDWRDPCSCTHV